MTPDCSVNYCHYNSFVCRIVFCKHSLPNDFVIRAIVYTFFKVFNFSKNFKIVSVLFTGEWSLWLYSHIAIHLFLSRQGIRYSRVCSLRCLLPPLMRRLCNHVGLSVSSLTQKVMHGFFTKCSSWPSLNVISFWRYLDWPTLSFRGHSRPARSFWHKIDCSAETVRDTVNVTIEH